MNLLSYVDERWFWRVFVVLLLAWAGHLVATRPGSRPTELVEGAGPPPVDLDALSLEGANRLSGQVVTAEFTVGTPAYTWPVNDRLRTVVGPPDRGDGAEWSVVLTGDRLAALDDGGVVRVKGVLRVIHHDATVVNGVRVEAWAEVRVEE